MKTTAPPARSTSAAAIPQAARARIAIASFEADVELVVTPLGLLAAGALVTGILLAIAPVVRAAKVRAPSG